jgi:paraquat-inducible protein B
VEVKVDRFPNRLRARGAAGEASRAIASREILDRLLQRGLTAQLRQQNLLTGQLYAALDILPGARTANAKPDDELLVVPTVPSTFTELQTTVARIARKLEDLPLQELSTNARPSLPTLDRTLAGIDQLGASVERRLLPQIEASLASMRATLREVARAADAIRLLAQLLERESEALLRGCREEK